MTFSNSNNALSRALGWGALCGVRAMLAPALASSRLRQQGPLTNLQKRAASPVAHRSLQALAVGEMIADKMEFIPPRTAPVPLLGRALSGATVALLVAPPKQRLKSALVGAGAALAAAVLAYHARRLASERLGLSSRVAGLIEDGLALFAGSRLD